MENQNTGVIQAGMQLKILATEGLAKEEFLRYRRDRAENGLEDRKPLDRDDLEIALIEMFVAVTPNERRSFMGMIITCLRDIIGSSEFDLKSFVKENPLFAILSDNEIVEVLEGLRSYNARFVVYEPDFEALRTVRSELEQVYKN